MAANTRIRVEPDIEVYLRSQSERVMGIAPDKLSGTELTTLTNRIIYEHKLAQSMMRQEFLPRLLGWLKGILPGVGSTKVVPIAQQPQQQSLPESDDLDFAADFAAQFTEDNNAA